MENGYEKWVWLAFTHYKGVTLPMVVAVKGYISAGAFIGSKTVLPPVKWKLKVRFSKRGS